MVPNGPILDYNIPKCWKFWVESDCKDSLHIKPTMKTAEKFLKGKIKGLSSVLNLINWIFIPGQDVWAKALGNVMFRDKVL